jgi:hypothetical protein
LLLLLLLLLVAPIAEVLPERQYPTGPLRQFISLLIREFVLVTRNPFDVAARSAAAAP